MGRALASLLNDAIDDAETDNRSRADIIEEMGSAAGIDSGTVNQILGAEIVCPPRERLTGFATVSGIPSASSQISAASRDGCEYEAENRFQDKIRMLNR